MSGYSCYTYPTRLLFWLGHWIGGWCDLIAGLSNILTLTFYRIGVDFTFRAWWYRRVEIPCMRRERHKAALFSPVNSKDQPLRQSTEGTRNDNIRQTS